MGSQARTERLERLRQYRDALALDYELAEQTPANFFRSAWEVLEPNRELKNNYHHDLIGEYLHDAYLRKTRKLLINLQPRESKSNLCTVTFPVWCWVKDPGLRFLCTSYADTLSTKHSIDRRTIIESPWFQARWGHKFKLSTDQNVKTWFGNDVRGHMIATSMTGGATGLGGDFVIADDPHNVKRADSDALREQDIKMWDGTFTERLDDKTEGVLVIVMQRLHEDDLSGHVLASNLGYTHVCLPGIAEKRTIIVFPRSGRRVVREEGDYLNPARQTAATFASQRESLTEAGFQAQIQQAPVSLKGEIFKTKFLGFWHHDANAKPPREYPNAKVIQLPTEFDKQLQSWDLTFKDKRTSDFVVGQVWGKKEAHRFLLDQLRARMSFTASLAAIRELSEKYPDAYEKLIEDAANGPAVEDTLKGEVEGVQLVPTKGLGKEERGRAVEVEWEAGNVWLPHPDLAPWVKTFIPRLLKFPKIKLDDEVDAFTQALLRFKRKKTKSYNLSAGGLAGESTWRR